MGECKTSLHEYRGCTSQLNIASQAWYPAGCSKHKTTTNLHGHSACICIIQSSLQPVCMLTHLMSVRSSCPNGSQLLTLHQALRHALRLGKQSWPEHYDLDFNRTPVQRWAPCSANIAAS